eukprot:Skav222286  [mRNA]  locus=scaffold807:268516:275563:- [translate_table: standard]
MSVPCFPSDLSVRCAVSHARTFLTDDHLWHSQNGQSFLLTVHRQQSDACSSAGGRTSGSQDPIHASSTLASVGPLPATTSVSRRVWDLDALVPGNGGSSSHPVPAPNGDEAILMHLPIREDTARLESWHDDTVSLSERSAASWEDFEGLWDYQCPARLVLRVWFIHHLHHTECRRSRTVVLTPEMQDWRAAVENAWRDVIAPDEPTFVASVHMPPPGVTRPQRHIIVWQRPQIDRVVALHVTMQQQDEPAPVYHAVSVSRTVRAQLLLDMAPTVPATSKKLRYLFRLVQPHLFMALTDGSTWSVHYEEVPVADAVGLLQRDVRRLSSSSSSVPVDSDSTQGRVFEVEGLEWLSAHLCTTPRPLCTAFSFPGWNHALPRACCELCPMPPGTALSHLEVYTDGAKIWNATSQAEVVAWAFMVVAFDRAPVPRPYLVGYASDMLALGDHSVADPLLQGLAKDPFGGECAALFHALLWICQCSDFQGGVPVHLLTDCFTALQGLCGLWTVDRQPFVLHFLRPLAAAVNQLGAWQAGWQPSHVGHPFNDAVDFLAKMAGRGFTRATFKHELPSSVGDAFPWLWMYWNSELQGIGPAFEHDFFAIRRPAPDASSDFQTWPQIESRPTQHLHLDFSTLTYNVNSLQEWRRPRGASQSWTSRTALLMEQFSVAASSEDTIDDLPHACSYCTKRFACHKSLAVHQKLMHSIAAEVRKWMPSPVACGSCMKSFHSTQKLRQHLQYPRGTCLAHLQSVWYPLTAPEIEDMATVKQCSTAHRLPAERLPGPLLPTIDQWRLACPHKTFPWTPQQVAPVERTVTVEEDFMDWLLNVVDVSDPSTWTLPTRFPRSALDTSPLGTICDSVEAWFPDQDIADFRQWLLSVLDPACVDAAALPLVSTTARRLVVVHRDGFVLDGLQQAVGYIMQIYDLHIQIEYVCVPPSPASARRVVDILLKDKELHGVDGVLGLLDVPTWSMTNVRRPLRTLDQPWGLPRLSHRQYQQVVQDNVLASAWIRVLGALRAPGLPVLQLMPTASLLSSVIPPDLMMPGPCDSTAPSYALLPDFHLEGVQVVSMTLNKKLLQTGRCGDIPVLSQPKKVEIELNRGPACCLRRSQALNWLISHGYVREHGGFRTETLRLPRQ